MSTITRRRVGGPGALVAIAIVAAGCASTTGADSPSPCLEILVASGRAYALDPGLAMAITTATTYDHPELGRLVDAVAEYQAAHPDTGVFDPDASDADVASLAYVLLVSDLAEQPGQGNLPQLHRYEQAARDNGMAGIYRALHEDAAASTAMDGMIPHLVLNQMANAREGSVGASQTLDLSPTACGASDEPG
jgi:hypothetical protein